MKSASRHWCNASGHWVEIITHLARFALCQWFQLGPLQTFSRTVHRLENISVAIAKLLKNSSQVLVPQYRNWIHLPMQRWTVQNKSCHSFHEEHKWSGASFYNILPRQKYQGSQNANVAESFQNIESTFSLHGLVSINMELLCQLKQNTSVSKLSLLIWSQLGVLIL